MLRSAAVGLALWRIKKMCLGMAHGCKDGICGMSVMSAEPADSRATPVADAQKHFLHLALAVAKHDAVYRARYPEDDPIYQMVEGSFFGTFGDQVRGSKVDIPMPRLASSWMVGKSSHSLHFI